jgi:aspartate aminotransferase
MTTVSRLGFRASRAVDRVRAASLRVPQPQSGPDIVSLAMGEPAFDTPPDIRLCAHAAIEAGYTHYAHPQGDPELRELLADQLSERGTLTLAAEDVLITHGGTGGLAAAILAIIDPGDAVVIPDPTYSLYADLIHLAGGRCIPVPLQADLHWDLDALGDALSGARLFVFCNPSNPTGIVHTRAELETVAGLLDTSDTLVLADEAYSDLVYTDKPFVSALDVPSLAARTLYCQTFSKAHAMTGWRIGYLAGPRDVIGAAARVHATIAGPLNAATQRAALAAADSTSGAVQRMRQEYRQRRDLMVSGLQSIDGLQLAVPDGAFYAFPRYEHALPATEMVAHLRLNGVAVRPGSEFGAAGERHLRLSFAADRDAITIGIDRMKAALTHSDPEAQR